jgi:hypothetical protein
MSRERVRRIPLLFWPSWCRDSSISAGNAKAAAVNFLQKQQKQQKQQGARAGIEPAEPGR